MLSIKCVKLLFNLLFLESYNKDIDLTKVFITGGTGFIGSTLVDKLIEKNYTIKCLVRKTSNIKWLKDKPVEYIHGDLWDKEILTNALKDVDYVYHVGGVTFAKKKEEYFRGNVEATKSLINICYEVNPKIRKFIHLSSQTVTGPSPSATSPVNEETHCNPITTYGRSKLKAEEYVKDYFNKMNITIVRAPAVYGPRDYAIFEYFKAMNKGLQALIGFGEKLVSLIHVNDLVDGIILAGESEQAKSNIYFISSEKFYTWKEIGAITSRLMGKRTITLRIPHSLVYTVGAFAQFFGIFSKKPTILNIEKCKDITQKYWTCSIEKAKRELGFIEHLGIEEGLKNTIEWYRRERWIK
jgi:dihydroflavonol-4-reductase